MNKQNRGLAFSESASFLLNFNFFLNHEDPLDCLYGPIPYRANPKSGKEREDTQRNRLCRLGDGYKKLFIGQGKGCKSYFQA
ncbi:MAG: hypothetical protein A2600_07605 [Candidatus Lambdaproteobacteria bacterium RIFOXYD1_FULL_56_27]|nr:MAG: hypothetical protein A2426_08245 [Candidatus Lambdaproteobacteria bacterium RIFOXYC1_FULL_56_13]OGH09632.1 MAG: hypothetical protein A2600_07605 [Candidatus Lambdaproteobacteria bacterium RIFOXYD1_FULL_56_27]